MKNINKKWFSILELIIVVLISTTVMVFWFRDAFNFYQNVANKYQETVITNEINEVINANPVWRWINRSRIKENVLIFRNWFNYIDNYYYTEVFKTDPITWETSSLPTPEFYWYETIEFPETVSFEIDDTIEWTTLINEPNDNTHRLWIKRIMPKNDLDIFDASEWYFQTVPDLDKQFFRDDFTFWKGSKLLSKWVDTIDDTNYYDVRKWVSLPKFTKVNIRVIYKQKHIWNIVIDTLKKKFVYVDKRTQN